MIKGKFTILGLHGPVARIRMFVNDNFVDEDFTLPQLPVGVPPTEQVYEHFLRPAILDRVAELENQ